MWNKREREETRMTSNLLACAIGQSMDSNEMGKILEGARSGVCVRYVKLKALNMS